MEGGVEALTVVLVVFGAFVFYLFRQVAVEVVGVIDALSISVVLLVPLLFLLFEPLTKRFSKFLGVEFPFVLMFGFILFISFLIMLRLLVQMTSMNRRLVKLIQYTAIELSEKKEIRNEK